MNILTFDIEDWYNHDDYSQDFDWDKFEVRLYEGVDKILDALNENNIKGTFLCLGWIAEKHPEIIRRIDRNGHHIGCHSYQHQLASRFTQRQFKEDTYKAKQLLEDVIGREVNAFRVPSFSITRNNSWAFDVLAELGFVYDCSVFPDKHEFGGIPGFPAEPTLIKTRYGFLKEFPICQGRLLGREIIYSGGGYFRVVPYNLVKKMADKSNYVMAYFHPSDFDPGQPPMPQLSFIRQFKNRVALKGCYSKFKRFLSDFEWKNLLEADKNIEWKNNQVIDIHNF